MEQPFLWSLIIQQRENKGQGWKIVRINLLFCDCLKLFTNVVRVGNINIAV